MRSLRILGVVGAAALALGLGANKAHAVGVLPGTVIDNTASVNYTIGSVNATATSNLVTVTVVEILDVLVTAQTPIVPVNAGAAQQASRYLVTNIGNGTETFRLIMTSAIAGDDFDPTAATPAIYLDSGGGVTTAGVLDGSDIPYVVGSNDPVLSPDGSVVVLVVNDIPAGVVDTNFGFTRLTADARTGSGAPGTTYAGQGTNGVNSTPVDAIVGNTRAVSEADSRYRVTGISMTAAKTQTVVGLFGAIPVPGARINYSIQVNVTGSGTATNSVFTDNIPANTTYVAGSLTLNTVALSDAVGDDAGDFAPAALPATPARVRVALGSLTTASGPQTVSFAVTIN